MDGSAPLVLSDLPFSQAPQWSPDGSQILFTAAAGTSAPGTRPQLALFIANADGSNRTRLTTDARPYEIQGQWSPDGRQIAFATSDSSGRLHLMIVNADGSGSRRVGVTGEGPRWSPDGKRLAYWVKRDDNIDIYAVRTDGSGDQRLTNHPGRDEAPSWSPDGSTLAFQSDRDGAMSIYLMKADGSGVRRLLPKGP